MPPVRDKFYGQAELLSDPGDTAEEVVADGVDFPHGACKYLYIGTGGAVLRMKGKNDDAWHIWANVPSGTTIPFRALAVHADTNCDDILAIY